MTGRCGQVCKQLGTKQPEPLHFVPPVDGKATYLPGKLRFIVYCR